MKPPVAFGVPRVAAIWRAHGVVAVATLVLWAVPLYNTLGFEFAVVLGCVLAYVSGWRAAGVARAARRHPDAEAAPFPGTVWARTGFENLTLAVTPLLLMGLRSFWVPACNAVEGLGFYAVLVLPAVLYGSAFGFTFGLGARRPRATFILWSVATYVSTLIFVLAEPQKFAYNAFIGFFAGPLYDTEIPLSATLVLARAIVVAQAIAALLVGWLAWDGRRGRLSYVVRAWQSERAVVAALLGTVLAGLGLTTLFSAPLGLRIDRAFIQRTLGGEIETPHVHLYFARSALTEARARALAVEHETRYAQLSAFFGRSPGRRIGSYVYASAEQKKRLMGAGGTSFEDAVADEFHINSANDDPHPVLTHEMAHIFAAQIDPWVPVCWKIGIHEGIAVAAEWADESARLEMTPHEACAAMDSLHLLPDIERALSAWGFWTLSGSRAYTAAGSFVRYLVDTYGMARFNALWRRGDFEAAYGKHLSALTGEWRAIIHRTPPTAPQLRRADRLFGSRSIFAAPCAHETAQLESQATAARAVGDGTRAESTLSRLLAIDPDDPARLVDWGRAKLAGGDARGALELAGSALTDAHAGPSVRDRALRLSGDAAWHLGRVAAADSFYLQGLTASTSSDDARAYEVLRAALGDTGVATLLRDYLTDVTPTDAAALGLLVRARLAVPADALPRYLFGRRLYFAGQPEAAAVELDAALASATLGPLARRTAEELRARADFAAGNSAAAEARFRALATTPGIDTWRRLGALDWAARAAWRGAHGTAGIVVLH